LEKRGFDEFHEFISTFLFTVCVLPQDSILDIRQPQFGPDGALLGIRSYMDNFPFPFYVILRDIDALPSVLGDALRQWFELVTAPKA
jgi:midasin (ATPase involved in ribosome maturation)